MMGVMLSREHLRELLKQIPGATDVIVEHEGSKLIAIVVSPEFDGLEEHARQREVWDLLLENLQDDEVAQVGYVFTNTQAEKDAAATAAS